MPGGGKPGSESFQRPTPYPGGSSKATAVICAHSRGYSELLVPTKNGHVVNRSGHAHRDHFWRGCDLLIPNEHNNIAGWCGACSFCGIVCWRLQFSLIGQIVISTFRFVP